MASGLFVPSSILNNPSFSFKFAVEMKGVTQAIFTECEGLRLERDVVEQKEGGTNNYVHKFPGRIKTENIRLRRAVMFSPDIWDWFNYGVVLGRTMRTHLTITVLGPADKDPNNPQQKIEDNVPKQVWDVLDAWPVKYEGPELKVDSVQAAVEMIEIAHHGLKMHKPTAAQLPAQ